MPKYKVIKTNPAGVESSIIIETELLSEAQTIAQEFVNEYNNLGNDHSTDWILKSVTELISVAPPSTPDPEPVMEAPPRDPE
jgi:hypothetical protein